MSVYQVWKTRHFPFFCFVRRFAERPPIKTRVLMSLCFSTVPRSSTAAFVIAIAAHRMLNVNRDESGFARSARDKFEGDGSGVDLRRTAKVKTIWLRSCIYLIGLI